MEGKRCGFIEKAFEIPSVNSASSFVSNFYNNVKSSNKAVGSLLGTAELGVALVIITIQPVANTFSAPIEAVDSFGCRVLDTIKEKLPFIYESPGEILSSANKLIVNNVVTQTSLYGIDRVLSFTEKALNLVPSVAETHPDEKENSSFAGRALLAMKQLYSTVTTPVATVTQFVHERRKKIRKLRRNAKYQHLPPDEKIKNQRKKVSPKKRIQPPGFLGRLLALPRKVIAFIGVMAHERTILKLSEDPSIIQSPTTPGLKRCFDSITSSSDANLSELNNLEDYNSEEDPDYKTEESTETASSDVDSGSCDENEVADLIKDSRENTNINKNTNMDKVKVASEEKDSVFEVSSPKSPKKLPAAVQSQNQKKPDQKPKVDQAKAENKPPANQKKSEANSVGKSGDKDHPLANSTESVMGFRMVLKADKQTQTYFEDGSWQLVKVKPENSDMSIKKIVLTCLSQTTKSQHITISAHVLLISFMFVMLFIMLFHL